MVPSGLTPAVRQGGEPQAAFVVAGIAMGENEVEGCASAAAAGQDQLAERRVRRLGRQEREYLPLVMGQHVVERQGASALGGEPLP